MKTRLLSHVSGISVLCALVLLCSVSLAYGQTSAGAVAPRTATISRVQILSPSILRVRGAEMQQLLTKQVTVEGFYYDGSIPMVVDKFDRVLLDMPLPREAYVPIVGPVPTGLKSGARISVTGTLRQPTAGSPTAVQREPSYVSVSNSNQITVLQPPVTLLPRILVRMPGVQVVQIPTKYAVLIAGGADYANNHPRYWNDLKAMYGILRSKGYKADQIYVIYADGVAKDSSMPVNYSATKANIATVFNQLASKMTTSDDLYIMTNDHGGGFMAAATGGYPPGLYGGVIDTNGDEGSEGISEATYNLDLNGDGDRNDTVSVDETLWLWNDINMTDDEFAAEVNKITRFEKIAIQMKQCFSGGFIADLTAPNRIVMSSCTPTQLSWSASSLQFGEFTFWYFAALTGNKPDGSGTVNADTNGDGKISILEAYNFARSHDTRPETPFYEDNGVWPCHSGAMPSGGEGALGASTYLQ